MASNSDRARMVGSNFDRVRIVVVGDAGNTSEPMTRSSIAETSAVNPLSLSYRTGFTAERRLYLFSGESFKCAKVRNPISPAF